MRLLFGHGVEDVLLTCLCCRKERDGIARRLEEQLAVTVVSKEDFAREHDVAVESVNALVQAQLEDDAVRSDIVEVRGCLVSEAYQRVLSGAIRQHLEDALEEIKYGNATTERPHW